MGFANLQEITLLIRNLLKLETQNKIYISFKNILSQLKIFVLEKYTKSKKIKILTLLIIVN